MDFIPTFNRRMHGEESVTYLHPALEPILGETYAICITGDTLVLDAVTGRRWRVDALADRAGEFIIQGVDADGQPVKRTVSHWYDNGEKAVLRLTLRNGASLKATPEHRFLTERGWVMLQDLQPGDYVATPPALLAPAAPTTFDRRKLRVLAYLIADGGVSNLAQVNFFSKDPALLDDYTRCLAAFPDVAVRQVEQVRGVRRIATRHKDGRRVTSLLAWMREIGFKNPPGMKGGLHSHEKFVPDFVFTLSNEDIVYFLASLWDCDGYADNELWHYRTISAQLARDIQTLLLRLGIAATIDSSAYVNPRRGSRTAYQVTVYSTARLAALLQPHMLTHKRLIQCQHHSSSTIRRDDFLAEVRATTTRSAQALMQAYGIDSQHFYATHRDSPRIHVAKVQNIAAGLPLPRTQIHLRLHWEPIKSIEPAGVERVYDLTVEDIHNFVANNIIVHNCVYQEQIMQIASDLFGYSLGEADLMRRAVSKKKEKDLLQHKAIFKERGPSHGVDVETAEKIFDEIEFFANYGFNKSHATDYAWVTLQTAYLKTHYPEEYMTALLCIQFDDSDKVATFLEECRRLHIPVLPPDVNYSMVEFDIEVTPAGQRAIRFGMGAIKHAGVGVVQLIIDERQRGGPFATLEEFCLRLDLRAVGKRALESLIKVGALVSLHPERDALLAALDRLLSFSHDYHEDKKRGQKSLFGEQSAFAGHLEVPRLPPDKRARPREQLIWEKELLGLYVTGRPIDNFGDLERLRQAGFNQIVRLKEVLNDDASKRSAHGQKVRVAGEVVSLRKLQTKNNDSMCVFLLEDWHESAGVIEVVLFPKTWASLQAYFRSLPAPTEGTEREFGPGEIVIVDGELDTARDSVQIKANHVSTNFDVVTAAPMPELSPYLPDERQMAIGMDEDGNPIYAEAVFPGEELPPQNGYAPEYRPGSRPRTAADLEFLGEKALSATRHLRLYLRRSEDVDKDRRRLRRLHGILTQYPGDDHFSFVIQGGGQKHITMNFPNHTTRYCRALLDELADEVGEDSIVIR
jgi:DNA polymerase-3 subunit alpha